ncbi:MAG: DUF2281 domain-containing protein [Defluviitaleaceae bacterium]|nr:DUF2281 domain-containing protein [Defluviitaleaceae bacterium]
MQAHLDELIEDAQNKAQKKPRESMFGYLRGEYAIANDFDAPLEDFKEYMGLATLQEVAK